MSLPSLQAALQFIQKVRQDESLRSKINRDQQTLDLDNMVALGTEAGFVFTTDELRTAFKYDWAMRWYRYHYKEFA